MSYLKENELILTTAKNVKEALKGTRFQVYIKISEPDEPYYEEEVSEAWKEYLDLDLDYDTQIHRCDERIYGQGIAIMDPTVQAPRECGKHFDYKNPLMIFEENYENYNQYTVTRQVGYMYDCIDPGVDTKPFKDWRETYVTHKNLQAYIKDKMLEDLEILSAKTKDLKELRESINLSQLKLTKGRY